MPNPFSFATFSFVKSELARRLYDPSEVFWNDAELGLLIQEALRTWNAFTSYWRGDFLFNSQQGVAWYDLTDATNLPNTLRPLTLHDTDLYTQLQYHLLEPIAWNPWTGASTQFTADDLLNAIQRRRDEILSITGCTITRRLIPAVAGRIALPDTVLDVRRMAYLPQALIGIPYGVGPYGMGPYGFSIYGGVSASTVWPDDTWAEQSYNRNYTIAPAGTPQTYLMSTQPPISFDTDRPPGGAGNYELLTVEAGPTLSVTTPTTLAVPDDWTHVIKWGALADLLSRESLSRDPTRATYCEQRYRMGLKMLLDAPALLAMRIGNVPLQIDSVHSADLYNTGWQATAQNKPSVALHAGLNMLALAPIPGIVHSMTATVVENAPVPVAGTDLVQCGRDELDAVLDYAQHIASWKQGGSEFLSTVPLFRRFMKQAMVYNSKLAELGEYTTAILELSQREAHMNPVATPALSGATSAS
jgi:hypothetical protein